MTDRSEDSSLGFLAKAIIVLVGVFVIMKGVFASLNKGVYGAEKALVVVATLAMTGLVFNVYLMEQATSFETTDSPTEAASVDKKQPDVSPPKTPTHNTPASPEKAITTGPVEVVVTGEATEVQLVSNAGTFDMPNTIERGDYAVRARFDGWDAQGEAGQVTLTGEGPITLKCDPFAETCRVKKKRKRPAFLDKPNGAKSDPAGPVEVVITGDATEVQLVSDDGTFDMPGSLQRGEYTVRARFDGWDAQGEAGQVTLTGDGPITLKCDPFAETCRVKKKKKRPAFMDNLEAKKQPQAPPPEPEDPVSVTVRGGGVEHSLEGPGGPYLLPSEVLPGQYVIKTTFPDIGNITSGTLNVESDSESVSIYCNESAWQCVEDAGWWNIWGGEGQLNFALMLMVAMGFLGASIATVQGKHLAVDATERVLSSSTAGLVKRFTSLVAAGLCFILMNASWEKIIDPESGGSTFPGAKVWWWMVKPINWATQWLPGDKYGPSTQYLSRSSWEDAMINEGQEWPFELAFSYVQQGDGFPLWIPLLFLLVAFGIMGLRFFSGFLAPSRQDGSKPTNRRKNDLIVASVILFVLGTSIWFGKGALIIASAILLVLLGSPLFIAVGVATLAGWLVIQGTSATTVVSDMFEATKKQEIIAIPFFVLAGNLMTHGSIAKRLIAFAQALVGPLPGGLGLAAVGACAIFAAISGSSPATVIAIGSIMFPMLIKEGYSERFSLGLLSTSGSLGIIIPPSVPMIIYAVMVSNPSGPVGILSPTKLFLGGIIPGLLIAGALAMYTLYVNWPSAQASVVSGGGVATMSFPWQQATLPPKAKKSVTPDNYFNTLVTAFFRGIPSLMLPVIVLGGIYGWFPMIGLPIAFDVTQAAAIAVVYALVVEIFVHRELKATDVPNVCIETASMIGSLFLILVIAISLNKLLVLMEVPQQATEFMLQYTSSPLTFLIAVNIFLLLLGCVMDIISAILIVAPLLAPIAAMYGIHPIHFGIMFIVNLELGYLTPPMGINLFVASTTFGRSLVKVIQSIVPFLVVMLFCLLCVIWLPRWFQSATCVEVPGLPAFTENYMEENNICQPSP